MLPTAAVLIAAAVALASPARQAPAGPPARSPGGPSCTADATLGLDAGPITQAVRTRLALPPDVTGVVVTHVLAGGPAAHAGLRVDDVIVAVDGTPVATECAVVDAAWGRDCEDALLVAWRAGQSRTLVVRPADTLPLLGARCDAGDAHACFRQAWSLRTARATDADRAMSLTLYDRSCRGGSGQGCAYYGVALGDTPGRANEQREAFERACALNDGPGCSHLAYLHAGGDGVPRDHAKATSLYEQSCRLGDPAGCFNVGLNYESGRGVARDLARAAAAYDAGCTGGNPMACTNLGGLLQGDALGTPDAARAVASWALGCAGSACQGANLLGCVNLARAYRDGIGTQADPARAAELFTAVCENAIDDAVPAATQQVKACALLGGMHLAGTAPAASATRGRDLSAQACDQGDGFACFNAATAHAAGLGGPVEEGKAAVYFESGCTAGDAESCYEFSLRLADGRGVPPDATRARTLRAHACAAGFRKACASSAVPR